MSDRTDEDDTDGDGGPLALLIVVPVLVTWLGIPTVVVAVAGLASMAVRFTLFGGGDSPSTARGRHRKERRWDF